MPATPLLFPLNDFAFKIALKEIDSLTGVKRPLTTGTVTGFLSTGSDYSATAADATLVCTLVHLGGGSWLVFMDASILIGSLLNGLFASTPPNFITVQTGGVRTFTPCVYAAARQTA